MNKRILFTLLIGFTFFLSSCIKDDFDAPESNCLDQGQDITNIVTIADLKANYNNAEIDVDAYVKAVVTASDRSGNIYKEFYIQDATGALAVGVDITKA